MKDKMLFIVFPSAIAGMALVGTGCNMANSFGKDMQNAGEGIQNGTK